MKYYLVREFGGPEKIIQSDTHPENYQSISGGYDTKDELIEKQRILSEPCKECGCIVSTNYMHPTDEELVERNLCFHCNFWENIYQSRSHRHFVDNHCYTVCQEDHSANTFKGFGGRKFTIRVFDSQKLITTSNLWHQGEVPEHFRDRLPNTAEFVKE